MRVFALWKLEKQYAPEPFFFFFFSSKMVVRHSPANHYQHFRNRKRRRTRYCGVRQSKQKRERKQERWSKLSESVQESFGLTIKSLATFEKNSFCKVAG